MDDPKAADFVWISVQFVESLTNNLYGIAWQKTLVAFSLRHARYTLLRFQVVNLSLHHPLLQCQVVHLPLLHPMEGLLPDHVLLMKLHHTYSTSREGALSGEPPGPA